MTNTFTTLLLYIMNTKECDREISLVVFQKYKKIHANLSTIVNTYGELIILDCNYEHVDDLTVKKNVYKTAKMKINDKINDLLAITNKQLQCHHNFIDDYIDLGPERSQKITYCTLCEYTKPL